MSIKAEDRVVISQLIMGIDKLCQEINLADIYLMEVCGTHTMSIYYYGLKNVLPTKLHLLSGPGCPVCVMPTSLVDGALELAADQQVIFTSFGDMLRVPGSHHTLSYLQTEGADIRIVYSPLEALEIARQNPTKEVIFWGVGFETTAPLVGAALQIAQEKQLTNFSVYCCHRLMPNALRLILAGKNRLNGLILPGHVAAIVGRAAFDFLQQEFQIPGVIAGFEAKEILQAIYLLLKEIKNEESSIINGYPHIVTEFGNLEAQKVLTDVFVVQNSEWRGFGMIDNSGLAIAEKYQQFDAGSKFNLTPVFVPELPGCCCGLVLRGEKEPADCPLLGSVCTPTNPVGPCMVAAEGSCGIYYQYQVHHSKE